MIRLRKHAFTLIELLVVVAIIGLLIAILMPSLGAARATAKSTVCLSNLRQIGMQNAIYMDQYNALPPVRLKQAPDTTGAMADYYHDFGRDFKRKAPRWQWFIAEGVGPVIDPDKYPDEATFNNSMIIDNPYWEDPAMPEFANDVRNGAYGYNGTYLGNTRNNASGTGWVRWPIGETRIRDAGQTILAGDSRGGSSPHGNHSYWLDPPKKAVYKAGMAEQAFAPDSAAPLEELGHSPVEARHRGNGNVAFVDGHAASMTLEQLGYQMDPSNTSETMKVDDAAYDRTKCDNKLWAGTGQDDPVREFIY